MSALDALDAGRAFQRFRTFSQSARFAAPHASMGLNPLDVETAKDIDAGRRVCLLGPSGVGKSTVMASTILAVDGMRAAMTPIRLDVAGNADVRLLSDPRWLAGTIVTTIAGALADGRLAKQAALVSTVTEKEPSSKATFGGGSFKWERDLGSRTTSWLEEKTIDQALETLCGALGVLTDTGLRPVLLLEDSDGLLRVAGLSDGERRSLADGFFGTGLDGVLRAAVVPAIVAAQPEYAEIEGFRRCGELWNERRFQPPREMTDDGVRYLLARAVHEAGVADPLDAVFDSEAVIALCAHRHAAPTMRDVIAVCEIGLSHAIGRGSATIGAEDIGYGISERMARQ